MRLLTLTLFSLLILATWTRVLAQDGDVPQPGPVILTDEEGEYPLGLHLEIRVEASCELAFEDVASPEFDSQFVPSQAEVPNYGFTDSAYWVRLQLRNETSLTDRWLLEVCFPNMHFVDLYTPLPEGGGFEVKQTGNLRPLETRDIRYPNIVFNEAIPAQSQQTYYLRFKNDASMTLPLTLWMPNAFLMETQQNQALHGLFFGALIVLLLYNLFLLFSLREMSYLYLVIFLAAILMFDLSFSGYLEAYLIPDLYYLKKPYLSFTFTLISVSIILFTNSFLELKTRLPQLYRVNLAILGIWVVLLLLTPFASYRNLIFLTVPLAVVSMVAVLTAGIISWRQSFHSASFFMIAWFGFVAALFLSMLIRWTFVPSTLLTENAFRFGTIWMAVFWSLALADRINLLKAETEGARRRLSQILEGLPIGVVVYGTDQKPTYMNRRTSEILTNTAQEIAPDLSAGRTLAQAADYFSFRVAGSDQAYPIEKMPVSRALEGEPSSADDLEVDLMDKRVPLEVWGSPVRDDAGNIESAVVAFQDITRRKQRDAELAEYRQNLEQLVENRTAELRAVEGVLRQHIEWLSAFQEVSQTSGGIASLPESYEKLAARILQLFGARTVAILYWGEGGPLEAVCRWREGEPCCEVKSISASFKNSFPQKDEIEREAIITIPADQAASLPAPFSDWCRDPDFESLIVAPMIAKESSAGMLSLTLARPTEAITQVQLDLIEELSHDLASLTENAQLVDRSLALVTMEERNRLARDLHDSVTQTLFTASVFAEATPYLWDKDPEMARNDSKRISVLLRGALAEMRSLLLELRAEELYEKSLGQLLTTLVEAVQVQTRAVITISMQEESGLPQNVSLALYRIAREALNNIVKHADATQINIFLLEEPDRVELRIQDNGTGFDPQAVSTGHLGISIMAERAAQIGGDLRINGKPGQGTEIVATWLGDRGETGEHE